MNNCHIVNLISQCLLDYGIKHQKNTLEEQLKRESVRTLPHTLGKILKKYQLKSEIRYSEINTLLIDQSLTLVYLQMSRGRYVHLKNISIDNKVCFYDPVIDKNVEMSLYPFLKLWNNVQIKIKKHYAYEHI